MQSISHMHWWVQDVTCHQNLSHSLHQNIPPNCYNDNMTSNLSVHNCTRTCHFDGTGMFIDRYQLLEAELRVFEQETGFCKKSIVFCDLNEYCFTNVKDVLRNVPKQLRKNCNPLREFVQCESCYIYIYIHTHVQTVLCTETCTDGELRVKVLHCQCTPEQSEVWRLAQGYLNCGQDIILTPLKLSA